MNIALWIVQGLLAAAFLMAGGMKMAQPKEKLAQNMAWVEDFSQNAVRTIGLLEVLGAIGLILPLALKIWPVLTGVAAIGLVLTMIGAAITHTRRGEMPMLVPNIVLGALAAFVAVGRLFL
ncbi:MAG: DoxX family protein [Ardenticatenaceae bacterium]|nr:DoxX family protein [Ardenticatenaceae bacterium]MCB8972894.1 DoxX family protein [Ardenticatenaceae bacterium]